MKKKQNRRPSATTSAWAEVRGSAIHGRGMFATKWIPRGTRVIEYTGERVSKAEALHREELRRRRLRRGGDGNIYTFEVTRRQDIDGRVPWNTARFINHSCEPNCESQIVRGRVWIVALRAIRPGEELVYDYCYDYDHYEDHPCRCGAPGCAGYIVKSSQRWRVRHAAAKRR